MAMSESDRRCAASSARLVVRSGLRERTEELLLKRVRALLRAAHGADVCSQCAVARVTDRAADAGIGRGARLGRGRERVHGGWHATCNTVPSTAFLGSAGPGGADSRRGQPRASG
jgi:hypothetical protein